MQKNRGVAYAVHSPHTSRRRSLTSFPEGQLSAHELAGVLDSTTVRDSSQELERVNSGVKGCLGCFSGAGPPEDVLSPGQCNYSPVGTHRTEPGAEQEQTRPNSRQGDGRLDLYRERPPTKLDGDDNEAKGMWKGTSKRQLPVFHLPDCRHNSAGDNSAFCCNCATPGEGKAKQKCVTGCR